MSEVAGKYNLVPNTKPPEATFQDNCIAEALTNDGLFTPEECTKILALAEGKWKDSKVGKSLTSGDEITRREEVRNNHSHILIPNEDNLWVFTKLLEVIMDANKQFYRFDVDHFNAIQNSK